MKVRLVNRAWMPATGVYHLAEIDRGEFVKRLVFAYCRGHLVSYLRHQQSAEELRKLSGVPMALSCDQEVIDDGDELLIIEQRLLQDAAGQWAFRYLAATFVAD